MQDPSDTSKRPTRPSSLIPTTSRPTSVSPEKFSPGSPQFIIPSPPLVETESLSRHTSTNYATPLSADSHDRSGTSTMSRSPLSAQADYLHLPASSVDLRPAGLALAGSHSLPQSLSRPLSVSEQEKLAHLDRLKDFLATAPSRPAFLPAGVSTHRSGAASGPSTISDSSSGSSTAPGRSEETTPGPSSDVHTLNFLLDRFMLPSQEYVSCVLWNEKFYITGTDIVRALAFRFEAFGRPVWNMESFEKGVLNILRDIRPRLDASLEEANSPFLDLLFRHQCVRTQRRQKVFYWFSVNHDHLFLDVLERELKLVNMRLEPATQVVGEPAMSFAYYSNQSSYERSVESQGVKDGEPELGNVVRGVEHNAELPKVPIRRDSEGDNEVGKTTGPTRKERDKHLDEILRLFDIPLTYKQRRKKPAVVMSYQITKDVYTSASSRKENEDLDGARPDRRIDADVGELAGGERLDSHLQAHERTDSALGGAAADPEAEITMASDASTGMWRGVGEGNESSIGEQRGRSLLVPSQRSVDPIIEVGPNLADPSTLGRISAGTRGLGDVDVEMDGFGPQAGDVREAPDEEEQGLLGRISAGTGRLGDVDVEMDGIEPQAGDVPEAPDEEERGLLGRISTRTRGLGDVDVEMYEIEPQARDVREALDREEQKLLGTRRMPRFEFPISPTLEILGEAMVPDAIADSSTRYAPRCYPKTRTPLIDKVQNWVLDDRRIWNMLWLHGLDGVGKSVFARTIAEFALEKGCLGAAFFFSRPNGCYNAHQVFITLAYQLAVRFPGYLPLVARQLVDDPDLLMKSPQVQFRRLIIEPLRLLAHQSKYLIVLDGLDECTEEQAQLDIIELINDSTRLSASLPVIWMICSRATPHLVDIFSRADFAIQCWREELAIDSSESREDTERFIRGRFKEIHEKYRDIVDEEGMVGPWPSEDDTSRIIDNVSGLFVLASTMSNYIEDPEFGQPKARLADVLMVIQQSRVIGRSSPMKVLDQLYTQILSGIPENMWPVTRRLLRIATDQVSPVGRDTPQLLYNFMGIDGGQFGAALEDLHSVLDVPLPEDAETRPIRFLHSSFFDYLVNLDRFGPFYIISSPRLEPNDEMQRSSLRFMGTVACYLAAGFHPSAAPSHHVKSRLIKPRANRMLSDSLPWPSPDPAMNWEIARVLFHVARSNVFSSYAKFRTHDDHQELIDELRTFDFNTLAFTLYDCDSAYKELPHFICWTKKTALHDLVRTQSTGETDDRLLLRATESQPLDFDVLAAHKSFDGLQLVYFLLGYGTNSVLVLVRDGERPWIKYHTVRSELDIWPALQLDSGAPQMAWVEQLDTYHYSHAQDTTVGYLPASPDLTPWHRAQHSYNTPSIGLDAESLAKPAKSTATPQKLEDVSGDHRASVRIAGERSRLLNIGLEPLRMRPPHSPDTQNPDRQHFRIRDSQSLDVPSGPYADPSNLIINNSSLVDNSQRNIYDLDTEERGGSAKRDFLGRVVWRAAPVFDMLEPFITRGAAVDSSAREPLPRCHPGTRARLHRRLDSWLVDHSRLQTLIWLRGPVGTGKSAVAQTFAEHADDHGRLGAAFFFSGPNKYNKPLHVVPTLAYQLASKDQEYRALLTDLLVTDRLVLKAALGIQFRKLLIEPFSVLVRRPTAVREPLLIVLDGLEECEGEDAQCEIIRMIIEAADPENKLPFLWLVCSRPEPHIVLTFSATESSIHIAREQLVSDLETRNDVDQYLRDEFGRIRDNYSSVLVVDAGEAWPSSDEFDKISGAVSGLFIFAATALGYIDDPACANPKERLQRLLKFLDKSRRIGAKGPLDPLDELYRRILSEIPDHILPTTMRILELLLCEGGRASAQAYSNFLLLEQSEFYTALRRLHSVLEIPAPEDAFSARLTFYHASFGNYLQDQARSCKYFIDKQRAFGEMVKRSLYWFALPVDIADLRKRDAKAAHFSWMTSEVMKLERLFSDLAKMAADLAHEHWRTEPSRHDPDSFSLVSYCNFTNFIADIAPQSFINFMSVLYDLDQRDFGSNIIRTEIGDAVDARHLQHLAILAGPTSASKLKPATFPLDDGEDDSRVLYFFLGHGPAHCVVCYARPDEFQPKCYIWRGDKQPSDAESLKFRGYMQL